MKTICIAGRLGKAADLRRTRDGDPVLSFSIAVDDGYGQNKSTLWFECSLFGKRGEALAPHLAKGTPVTVSGDLTRREYEGKTYLGVRVNDLTMHGGKQEGERKAAPEREPAGGAAPDMDDDGDLPF